MEIKMNEMLRIENPENYKLHLACESDEGVAPLDDFVGNRQNWLDWHKYRGKKNDWTRELIFSLIEFYPRRDTWLFGGTFHVLKRLSDRYEIEETGQFKEYVGRLLLSFHRYQGMRQRAYRFEEYINEFRVAEILLESYSGESFPGYNRIMHDFGTIEGIIHREKTDWKATLLNVKGVYLISDKSNGKHYIGSAYGESGIWSRWASYIANGHGGDQTLEAIIAKHGIAYARRNYIFSLLEVMLSSVPDEAIIERETYWKTILLSREHGYNIN